MRSCTADAKTWETTDARYSGTVVVGNAMLAGSLAIHAKTTYSTTDKLGYVNGSFQINDDDSRVKGKFSGTHQGQQARRLPHGQVRGNHATVSGT